MWSVSHKEETTTSDETVEQAQQSNTWKPRKILLLVGRSRDKVYFLYSLWTGLLEHLLFRWPFVVIVTCAVGTALCAVGFLKFR